MTALNTWDDLRSIGVDPAQMSFILFMETQGVLLKEHENAETYAARVDAFNPQILLTFFKGKDAAVRCLTRELNYFHDSLHVIRVHRGWTKPRLADGFTILAACKTAGVKVAKNETGASFSSKVHAQFPGLLNHIAKTPAERDLKLDKALSDFRNKAREGRVYLLASWLMLVLTAIMTIFVQTFGAPAAFVEAQVDFLFVLKLALVPCFMMIYFAFRIRRQFARVEENPIYM